jgi:dTDP-4-amino-4,6-dideoxygalactose transaminase
VFVDIRPSDFNLDPLRLAELLERGCVFEATSGRLVHRSSGAVVKAIVPVHLYGQCAAMDDIQSLAQRYRLPVVEDACQALGAAYRGRPAGSMGDLGCFSFFPTKNLGGAGDGGMVTGRDEELVQRVRLLRNHGMQPKYFHSSVGFNSRLDEIQAAVLRVKLAHLEGWIEARRRIAAGYDAAFGASRFTGRIHTPAAAPGVRHIFHQYVIRCARRDELREALRRRGVGTEIYYPVSLHQQECFRYLGCRPEDFPESNAAAAACLALPVYPELTAAGQEYVVQCIADFFR